MISMIVFSAVKRGSSLFSAALSLLVSLAACAAPSGADPIDGKAATTENGSAAEPGEIRLGEELLQSIQAEDYTRFSRTLAGKTDFDISRKDFDSSCGGVGEKYGKLKSWTHLTTLDDPIAGQNVWKVRFIKDRAEGEPVERDMLFRLACAKIGEKTSVLAFGFF